jgi:hypothetical protein
MENKEVGNKTVPYTECAQNNRNTKKLRNRTVVGYTERT